MKWWTQQCAATRHSLWRMRRAEALCGAWRASCGYPRQAPLLGRAPHAKSGKFAAAVCLAAYKVCICLYKEQSQYVTDAAAR